MKNRSLLILFTFLYFGTFSQPGSYHPLKSFTPPVPTTTKKQKARPILSPSTPATACKTERRGNFISLSFTSAQAQRTDEFFQKFKNELGTGANDAFRLLNRSDDKLGFSHFRYDHYYKGVPVRESQLILHEKAGQLKSVNGKFIRNIDLNIAPLITEETAIQSAIKSDGAQEYFWEKLGFPRITGDPAAVIQGHYPVPRLVIMHDSTGSETENYRACYELNLNATIPFSGYAYYVDVQTGTIINRIPLNQSLTDVPGTANTLYYGTRNITIDTYLGAYRLRENIRPVKTLDLQNNYFYNPSYTVDFVNSSTNWNSPEIILDSVIITGVNSAWTDNGQENPANGEFPEISVDISTISNQYLTSYYTYFDHPLPDTVYCSHIFRYNPIVLSIWDWDNFVDDDSLGSFSIAKATGNLPFNSANNTGTVYRSARNNPALDAHWGIEQAYDYYKYVMGRNSYDDSGASIETCVHFKNRESNAYWSSNDKVLLIGDGDGKNSTPWSSIDIVGHELTHAVISSSSNLTYQGESGALNESFADIFGTCIKSYAGITTNWKIGDQNILNPPFFLRSLSDPNSGLSPQPDTHRGDFWYPPTQSWDYGGVHTNSGVQNFWFYLLCNGGSGTNDKGNAYNVPAIGLNSAQDIAYRNMVYYMTPGSDYHDAYSQSLNATDDLFGPNSPELAAVRAAWWAVGLGNDPNLYCHGLTWYAWPSYSFSDGSGRADYNNNSNCTWLLAPTGADSLVLVFTSFDTESVYDSVIVYDGPNENYPVVTTWWGNTLPPPITSTSGALFIRFVTDNTITGAGWSAYYVGYGLPACFGISTLTDASGTFEDGSGVDNYTNNLLCGWLIAPPCATSVTLNFNNFSTESGYDIVYVYDGNTLNSPLLWSGSGSGIPSSITSSQGEMLVVFLSDFSVRYGGWTAGYTSTGAAICSGVDLRTLDSDIITDGSGNNNYCNNLNCGWLIQPPDVDNISLVFQSFDLEPAGENQVVEDAVEIYDGPDDTAPLLGRFAGNTLPPVLQSTGNSVFIKFFSNYSVNASGFSLVYFSNTSSYCTAGNTLTAPTGSLSDGSGTNDYANNTLCEWLIQPPNAASIVLTFTSLNTESNKDVVEIYNGPDDSSPLLAAVSGSVIPGSITASGGSMFIRFYSDAADRKPGWDASYVSTTVGLADPNRGGWMLYPNPAKEQFTLYHTGSAQFERMDLLDPLGRVTNSFRRPDGIGESAVYSLWGIAPGYYRLRILGKEGEFHLPLVIN